MKQRNSKRWVRAAVSVLLVLAVVCTSAVAALAAVPGSFSSARQAPQGSGVVPEKLTAQETSTERLIGDALAMNRSAVDALKQQKAYRDFLDTVAARQRTWVRAEVARMTKVLRGMGISPKSTVKELKASNDPEAKALYEDICTWLIEETEDSSVLPYSQFTTVKAIEGLDLAQLLSWSALQDFVDTIVPELLRYALEALKQLGFEFENDPFWPVLDQKAIVDYAHKYAKKYNPEYRVPDSGSDCTNFVSQALYAGGLSMDPPSIRGTNPGTTTTTEEWYYYNSPSATADTPYERAVAVSTSWVRVEDLYTYLAPHYDTVTSTNDNEVRQNLKEGYVIQGGKLVGRYEHSSIVTKKNDKWCYTAHTNDRKDRDMKHYFNAYDKFRIIKVC